MNRRSKSAVGSDVSESTLSVIKEEGDHCCDSLSFLHANILESSENLEENVCELEDKLFDIRKECLRTLSKKAINLEPLVSLVLSNKIPTDFNSSREETKSPIILKRFASCPVQTHCKKDVSADRYVGKYEPPVARLSKENIGKDYSVAASNTK